MTGAVDTKRQYTAAEVSELTGLSVKAIRTRMDRKTLGCVMRIRGGRRERLIPGYALMKAGLAGAPRKTKLDEQIPRMLTYLRARPEQPVAQHILQQQSGASRQAVEVAMATLLALDYVRKSEEPPPSGTGRPRIIWRWIA